MFKVGAKSRSVDADAGRKPRPYPGAPGGLGTSISFHPRRPYFAASMSAPRVWPSLFNGNIHRQIDKRIGAPNNASLPTTRAATRADRVAGQANRDSASLPGGNRHLLVGPGPGPGRGRRHRGRGVEPEGGPPARPDAAAVQDRCSRRKPILVDALTIHLSIQEKIQSAVLFPYQFDYSSLS